jgi:hypothetical protein
MDADCSEPDEDVIAALREALDARGLDSTGTFAQLEERLVDAVAVEQSPAAVEVVDVDVLSLTDLKELISKARMSFADCIDKAGGLSGGVEGVAFETVQGFDGKDKISGIVGHDPVAFGQSLPFLVRGTWTGKDAQWLGEGAAEHLGPEFVGAIHQPFEVVNAGSPVGGIKAHRIAGFIRDDADGGAPEAQIRENCSQAGVVGRVALKDRHFDPVITCGLEFLEDGNMVLGHMGGPEEKVETDLHGVDLVLDVFRDRASS